MLFLPAIATAAAFAILAKKGISGSFKALVIPKYMFTNACAFAIIFQFLEPFSAVPAKAPNNFDVACKFMSLYLTLISSFFLSINSKTSASPSPFFRACSNNNLPCSLNASNSLLRPISFNIEISLIPAILILFRSWCIFV